jgi:hypothetical protein
LRGRRGGKRRIADAVGRAKEDVHHAAVLVGRTHSKVLVAVAVEVAEAGEGEAELSLRRGAAYLEEVVGVEPAAAAATAVRVVV